MTRAIEAGIDKLDPERLRALCTLFAGDFLDGLEIDRSPHFDAWLVAQRRRFRGCHAALLEHLAGALPADEALGYLEKWLQLAPFDRRVHEMMLRTLGQSGRIREGEEHLAATVRLFEAEGLDSRADSARRGAPPGPARPCAVPQAGCSRPRWPRRRPSQRPSRRVAGTAAAPRSR